MATMAPAPYFTVTAFAKVGFGDIVAHDDDAMRPLVTLQMLLDLAVLGCGDQTAHLRAETGVARRGGSPGSGLRQAIAVGAVSYTHLTLPTILLV